MCGHLYTYKHTHILTFLQTYTHTHTHSCLTNTHTHTYTNMKTPTHVYLLELEVAVNISHDEHLNQFAVGHDKLGHQIDVVFTVVPEVRVWGGFEALEELHSEQASKRKRARVQKKSGGGIRGIHRHNPVRSTEADLPPYNHSNKLKTQTHLHTR